MSSILHPLYYFIYPQGATITPRAHGLDVSKYDVSFNPANAMTQLDFVAQRSSYRLTKDQAFDTIYQGVQKVPIRIAYHYYNFGYSGDGTWQDQVTFMLSVIKDKQFHATAWDYEGAFNVLNAQSAVNSYYAIKELEQRTGKPSMLYTSLSLYNQYIYPTVASHGLDWNSVILWLAQWLFTPDPNGTPSRPKGRLMDKYWDLWQYTDKGSGMGTGRDYPTDLDVFNGTVSEMKTKLNIEGGTTPPPTTEDEISHPFLGIKRVTGTRYGRAFSLVISDPDRVRFEVRHGNLVEYPSKIAYDTGAQFVWNGGEWDKLITWKPKDLSVTNGVTYVPRKTAVPSLFFLSDGTPGINHVNIKDQYNVTSGLRYIVRDGSIEDYLYGTEAKYTDRTARSIEGLDRDGHVMRLTVDGVYVPPPGLRIGVQLKEAAAIMIEFGATIAFDTGGGGDSCEIMNGVLMNVPEDISNGQNVQRAVPEFLLAFAEESTMANGTAQEQLGKDPTERTVPNTGNDTFVRKMGTGVIVEFSEIVPDTYPSAGRDWLHLANGNYVNYSDSGHNGANSYFKILQDPTTPPDPPTTTDSVWVQGIVEDRDAAGNVTARYETDLVLAKKVT